MQLTEINGLKFYYRPDTQDWNIIKEACGGLYTKYFDVEAGETWFDIGANIGAFTCYAISKGALVYAFEPYGPNFTMLSNNVALNFSDAKPDVHLVNAGLTNDGRRIELSIDDDNYGNCSEFRQSEKRFLGSSLPANMLNNYTDYCIKIDTEGAEHEIIRELDLTKVQKIVFEWHYWLIDNAASKLENIYNRLNEAGIFDTMSHEGYMFYAWR